MGQIAGARLKALEEYMAKTQEREAFFREKMLPMVPQPKFYVPEEGVLMRSEFKKNKHLDALINEYCFKDSKLDYDAIWSSIIANDGSVQHLEFLTYRDWEKDVYKTAMEIDQRWVIQHAADRQEYIDQAQSVNLFFRPDVS